jgi:hypothetical protein
MYQAYAHDAAGSEVRIGPRLSKRRAIVNSAINHEVDAEVRDEDGTVTDRILRTVDGRFTVEHMIPEEPEPVFFRPKREPQQRKRVSW